MSARVRPTSQSLAPVSHSRGRTWLLLVHQLPARSANLRVRTWRRLQQLGAIAVKQGVYGLPDSAAAREDVEWLKTQIQSAGGEASIFAAAHVDTWSDDALVEAFRRSRQAASAALTKDLEDTIRRIDAPRRRRRRRPPGAGRVLHAFRERLSAIERVDFFGSAGRDRVIALLAAMEERISKPPGANMGPALPASTDPAKYRGCLWVTRPRPGVDRMSSAWLIRRFIDPEARFGFAEDRDAAPRDALPFDMFGVEFTHRDDRCTFETLCPMFRITDAAVVRIGGLVHDLDLKDSKFGAPEAPAVGMIIDGLQLAYGADEVLLEHGMVLFDALYRAADRATRPGGPRVVAARRPRHRRRSRT